MTSSIPLAPVGLTIRLICMFVAWVVVAYPAGSRWFSFAYCRMWAHLHIVCLMKYWRAANWRGTKPDEKLIGSPRIRLELISNLHIFKHRLICMLRKSRRGPHLHAETVCRKPNITKKPAFCTKFACHNLHKRFKSDLICIRGNMSTVVRWMLWLIIWRSTSFVTASSPSASLKYAAGKGYLFNFLLI